MVLIIGGKGQGKRLYAANTFSLAQEDMAPVLGEQKVVCCLQDIVRELLCSGKDPLATITAHADNHPHAVYICDEVGCGAVPVDPSQRQWREAVGRCCCALASKAARVDRVFCGIGMTLVQRT